MITVELTQTEARGLELAGTATGENIAVQIELILAVGGMSGKNAKFMADKLAAGALSARKKIREATRYEIRVVDKEETE